MFRATEPWLFSMEGKLRGVLLGFENVIPQHLLQ